MWLTTLPGLIFGTLGVLAPLRLDELGAGSTAIAAVFLFAAALEAVVRPIVGRISDRRGRLPPVIVRPAGGDRGARLVPWPERAWVLGVLVIAISPAIGMLWAPAMSQLSDGAERLGDRAGVRVRARRTSRGRSATASARPAAAGSARAPATRCRT